MVRFARIYASAPAFLDFVAVDLPIHVGLITRHAEGAPVVSIWTLRDYALLIGRGYRTAAAPWRNARGAAHRLDHGRLVLDLAELERRKLGAASRARTVLVAYVPPRKAAS